MKKFIVVFDDVDTSNPVGIIHKYYSSDRRLEGPFYFKGWWAKTLSEAYEKYKWNKRGYWYSRKREFGCLGVEENYLKQLGDILYEITEETLLNLIKIEKASGHL